MDQQDFATTLAELGSTPVPAVLCGLYIILWAIAAIGLLSFLSKRAAAALTRLPPILSVLILRPAVAWHETCHAAGCLVAGHTIERVCLWPDKRTGTNAHVAYRYNPHSLWQSFGTVLAGWAPVIISCGVLIWAVPQLSGLRFWGRAAGYYGVAVMVLAMPLSLADWRSALARLWLIVAIAIPAGALALPSGMLLSAPWQLLGAPLTLSVGVIGGVWGVAWLARQLLPI